MRASAGAGVDVLQGVPDDAMMYRMESYHCYKKMQVQRNAMMCLTPVPDGGLVP